MRYVPLFLTCSLMSMAHAQSTSWINYTASVKVTALASDDQATWVGTPGGLIRVDLATSQRTFYNRSNSGLPSNWVDDIALGGNGDVWVGTEQGLAHFDGADWTTYTTSNSGLLVAGVWKVAVAPDESVWLSSQYTGDIQHLVNGNWSTINGGFAGVRALACAANGDLMTSSNFSGLYRYDGSTWTNWNTGNSNLPNNDVRDIAITPSGSIYLSAGVQLVAFDGVDFTTYPIGPDALYSSNVDRITLDDAGVCHVSAAPVYFPLPNPTSVLYPRCLRLVGDTWEDLHHYGFPAAPLGALGPIVVDDNNGIWTGMNQLTSLINGTWSVEAFQASGLTLNGITAIHVKVPNGTIWAGGQGYPSELYACDDGTNWSEFADGQFMGTILDITADGDGNATLATDNGLWRYNSGTWEVLTPSNSPLPSTYVEQVYFDAQGSLWIIPDEGGLYRYNGTWTIYNTSNSPLSSNDVNSITQDANGVFWIGTGNGAAGGGGISRFDGTTWTTWTPANSNLPFDLFVPSITVNSSGTPTFLLSFTNEPGQLATFDGADFTFTDSSTSALPARFTRIFTDANDVQWLATPFDGLFYKQPSALDWSSFNTTNSGLATNTVTDIDFSLLGDIWIATGGGGVNRLTVDLFETVTEGSTAQEGMMLIPSLSNELTEMRIDISAPERFFIDVLDASGRIVTELGMHKLPAGSHRLPINTADLAAGTYACRVTGGTVRRARFVVQH